MTPRCKRCNRRLLLASPSGYGPRCLQAVTGAKPARIRIERHVTADERQAVLFPGQISGLMA